MSELGHIALYVRDLQASLRFYIEVVGLEQHGLIFGGRGALLGGGRTHHELLLMQVSVVPEGLVGRRIGLYHMGWKVGENLEALKLACNRVVAAGLSIDGMSDHTITHSIYLKDPDGNEVELYVDNPEFDWSKDKSWMNEPVKPLSIQL